MPIIAVDKPLRPRSKNDFYPTPGGLVKAALDLLPGDFNPEYILDPGAGDGIWGIHARNKWPKSKLVWHDIVEYPNRFNGYDYYERYDYLDPSYKYNSGYDLIMGNPPYSLSEEFIEKSLELLKPDGYLMFLLRLTFLASQGRYKRLYSSGKMPYQVIISSRRPSFTKDGKTDADDYGIFIWSGSWDRDYFIGKHFYWDYLPEDFSDEIHDNEGRNS